MHGRGAAEDISPLQAKAGQIERREIGDRLSDRGLLNGSQRRQGETLAGAQ
jgi:hypothetical protein